MAEWVFCSVSLSREFEVSKATGTTLDVQNRSLELTLRILILSSLEHLTPFQPAGSPKKRPEEDCTRSRLKDIELLRVGSIRVDKSLSAITGVLSSPA